MCSSMTESIVLYCSPNHIWFYGLDQNVFICDRVHCFLPVFGVQILSLLSLIVAVVLYFIILNYPHFQSKAVAKTGGGKYQWQIMQSLGLSNEEIKKFADASYWLHHFPPLAVKDLRSIGIHVSKHSCFVNLIHMKI